MLANSSVYLLVVLLSIAVVANAFSNPSKLMRLARCQSHGVLMQSEATPAAPAAPEFLGAKKISLKDQHMKPILSSEQISKILPHRYPFLLVDRVVEFEPGKRAVGLKAITANEPQFTGHFPDRPIMPGVLMIEAMAQLGGIICLSPPINESEEKKLFFFTGVSGVRWKSPVTPGDCLVMEMNLVSFDPRLGFATMTGKAYVGGKVFAIDSSDTISSDD
jgi:3-hydroxyacyl-[acyl-carrier-protein] dehydratase